MTVFDPSRPESSTARRARIRAEMGLSDEPPERASPARASPVRAEKREPEPPVEPDEPDLLDELRGRLSLEQDSPEFWEAAKAAHAQLKSEKGRARSKAEKVETIGAGAVVTEQAVEPARPNTDALARELAEIQGGLKGSPSSPSNQRRRAAIMKELRRG